MPVQFCPSAAAGGGTAGRRERDGSCSWTVVGLTANSLFILDPSSQPKVAEHSTVGRCSSSHVTTIRTLSGHVRHPGPFHRLCLRSTLTRVRAQGRAWLPLASRTAGCALVTNERPGWGLLPSVATERTARAESINYQRNHLVR